MGPAGPKLLRYRVDYAGVAILTRKSAGLLGDVFWNNALLRTTYILKLDNDNDNRCVYVKSVVPD